MGWLSGYRKKRQERRSKREQAQAEARKTLHDEPVATRRDNEDRAWDSPGGSGGFYGGFLHT
jgi:hypothetical protein